MPIKQNATKTLNTRNWDRSCPERCAATFVKNSYGQTPGTVTNLLNDLEWEPLQERRKQARHKLLKKSLKEEVVLRLPVYLQRSVRIMRQSERTCNLLPFNLCTPSARTNAYKFSFFNCTHQSCGHGLYLCKTSPKVGVEVEEVLK